MRMELADDVANGPRGFFRLGTSGQPELAHGIHDTTLYRLQAVTDLRQRTIENDVHRIIEVSLLRIVLERQLLDAFEIQLVLHGLSCDRSDFCKIALRFEPVAPVGGALLGQQHVHELVGIVFRADGELHQAAGIAMHRGFAQLLRAHFAQPLEARYRNLAAQFLGFDAIENTLSFSPVERVEHGLADIDAKQRRHGNVDVPGQHQASEVTQEECTQEVAMCAPSESASARMQIL
jgi:hypothetical protein